MADFSRALTAPNVALTRLAVKLQEVKLETSGHCIAPCAYSTHMGLQGLKRHKIISHGCFCFHAMEFRENMVFSFKFVEQLVALGATA